MYLLSCVAFEFTDVLSLHSLEVLYDLRVNILSQGVWPSRDEPRESEGVSILLVLESERKEGGQNWNFVFEGFQNGAGGTVQKGAQKCEEDEIKGIQKWSRKCKNTLVVVTKIIPPPVLC